MKGFFKGFLPNLALMMLMGMVVIVIVDGFNPLMMFLSSKVTKVYILVMCAAGICACLSAIAAWRKR